MACVIVCDANVLIGFLDDTDAHHEAIKLFVEENFVEGFAASVLTLAEALVHPAKHNREIRSEAALRRIGMRFLDLEASDAFALARLRSAHEVRMPDAVVVHTALTMGSKLATTDRALARVAAEAGLSVLAFK